MAVRPLRTAAPYEAAQVAAHARTAWAALNGKALREGVDLYALRFADLLDVVVSLWTDELAEMRLLTTLAAIGGGTTVMGATRTLMEELLTEDPQPVSADSDEAVAAALSAEAALGGPA